MEDNGKVHLSRQISGEWIFEKDFDTYDLAIAHATKVNSETPDTIWKIEQILDWEG